MVSRKLWEADSPSMSDVLVQTTPKESDVLGNGAAGSETKPTRSYQESTPFERQVGFVAASVFSMVYVAAPLWLITAVVSIFLGTGVWTLTILWAPLLVSALLMPDTSKTIGPRALQSWPARQIPKYFGYEEFHEISDAEMQSSGKSYILACHPHGIFSFVGVCAFLSSMNSSDGYGASMSQNLPTAAASVLKQFPFLKDVLGVFGVIPADAKTLSKRLTKGSFALYVGGMAELFCSSPEAEAVFLKSRKGFIKLALRSGADVVPVYMFGNTTVLAALTAGPFASLSRKLGVSITVFWGRSFLPLPKQVPLTYVRGRPLGLPHLPEPTEAEVDFWHAKYCEQLVALFERYKGRNPDYVNKELTVE